MTAGVRWSRSPSFHWSAALVPAAHSAPGFWVTAPPKSEGGAGRRGPGGPTGLHLSRDASGAMLFDEAPLGCRSRKSANSPASRARCLKPALPDPRWCYRFGRPRLRAARLTTAAGTNRCTRHDPAAYRPSLVPSGARHSAPGPCSFGCRALGGSSRHPCAATAPSSVSTDVLQTPLMWRG